MLPSGPSENAYTAQKMDRGKLAILFLTVVPALGSSREIVCPAAASSSAFITSMKKFPSDGTKLTGWPVARESRAA